MTRISTFQGKMWCMAPELAHALTTVDPSQLGARIKATRVSLGLTQAELAGKEASIAFLSRIETGQRRPGPELLGSLAERLGVTVEFLVIGEGWEDARRLELQLDHAELSLVGGEAEQALLQVRDALTSVSLDNVPGGRNRARYVEAAALDTLGQPQAAQAMQALLADVSDPAIRLKAATALCRIWREQGQLERAIACARGELGDMADGVLASEEGVRLAVTLAAALYMSGRTAEAAELCDRAIAESERLSSPLARASAYWNASTIRANSGDVAEALTLAKRALHLLESTERVRDLGRLRTQMVWIQLQTDEPQLDDAREQLRLADTELDWSEAGPADRARNQIVQAKAMLMAGEAEECRAVAQAVLATADDDLVIIRTEALTLLGQAAWSLDDREGAQASYRQAIMLLTGAGADREAAQMWFELGTLAAQAGLLAESADAFRRAAASTGLSARLPVVTQPATSPQQTPHHAPAGRF
ncbi:helix-turn-helix domain-containing protein [Nocardioides anomalus]|uniref:Helix-turn-helix domain-containing protein n=1 Tax=Nocardioides anomalus TaxID=2712223 RepID=A0A6G6WII7_9ACTN|nr:helix-turn-helix transcriptional regulator [Nocardioides anomalus]QIG45032.1 helix-turn-helix domain-containing protein [Nocardioides anomalus]